MRVTTGPALLRDSTLRQISKAIMLALGDLPAEECDSLTLIYETTFQIASLTTRKLVTPSRDCRNRLEDFYGAIDRECRRRDIGKDRLTEVVTKKIS